VLKTALTWGLGPLERVMTKTGDGNRTRTVSLGSQWRCSAATCGSADLRAYCSADRETP
jgi:hypothetical protein